MTGETHKAGGMLCAMTGFLILRHNGLLLSNVNEFVQLAVMYPFAMWGSVASDLDHHWDSCPSKDPPSWVVNKLLHITTPYYHKLDELLPSSVKKRSPNYKIAKFFSANHRSWQTHSDLTLILVCGLLYSVLSGRLSNNFTSIDLCILSLMLAGLALGIVMHFILDMLTPEGVWLTCGVVINKVLSLVLKREIKLLPEKIHFVPKWRIFATGSAWENFVRKILRVATYITIVYFLMFIAFPKAGEWLFGLFPYELRVEAESKNFILSLI